MANLLRQLTCVAPVVSLLLGTILTPLALGAALTPGDILVQTDQSAHPADTLHEYTLGGGLVQSFFVPYPGSDRDTYPRDISVDPAGTVQIFNGNFAPYLTTLDPSAGTFTHHAGDFSVAGTTSHGSVAIFKNYVFVGDEFTFGSTNSGIVRFDTANNYATTRFFSGTQYERVSMGANGLLYALNGSKYGDFPGVDIINPQTMALIQSVKLAQDSRAVAVNAAGDMYVATHTGDVLHYDAGGTQVGNPVNFGVGTVIDLDLSPMGQIALGASSGNVILTDTSLSSYTSFKVAGTGVFVAFTSSAFDPWRVADINGDGSVTVGDLGILATNFNVTLAGGRSVGDLNLDGSVTVGDLGILATYFGQPTVSGSPMAFEAAIAEFPTLSVAVPEPASLMLFTLVSLLSRRVRGRVSLQGLPKPLYFAGPKRLLSGDALNDRNQPYPSNVSQNLRRCCGGSGARE